MNKNITSNNNINNNKIILRFNYNLVSILGSKTNFISQISKHQCRTNFIEKKKEFSPIF